MNDDWSWKRIAGQFDTHVRQQLPWYDFATTGVAHIARAYLPQDGTVYDVGAATGNIGNALQPVLNERNARLVAVEPEPSMQYDGPGVVSRERAEAVRPEPHDVSIWMLTLMFVPAHLQAATLRRFYSALRPGGCMVGVDRVSGGGQEVDAVMGRLTWEAKRQAGATPDEIVGKELQLSGVQRPLAKAPGRVWFRFGVFDGWVITKPVGLSW